MSRVRATLLVIGVLAAAYGVLRLLDLGWANTRATIFWLAGGVVIHDALFAPIVLAVALLAVRLVPRERLGPLVVGLVILVPTTLLAIPELGRFGARSDRPTLLDRHYWIGWWVLVAVVIAVVAVWVSVGAVVNRRQAPPAVRDDSAQPGSTPDS